MFVAALITNTILYKILMATMKKPLFAPKFSIPTRTDLTPELFQGAALFGVGWGIGGYCPGPAMVAVSDGNYKTLLFLVSMAAGMGLFKLRMAMRKDVKKDDERHPEKGSAITSAVMLVGLAAVALLYRTASGHTATPVDPHFVGGPWTPIAGGVMVGVSVALMMAMAGEILGIAGIVNGLFSTETTDKAFRAAFTAGLITASLYLHSNSPDLLENRFHRSAPFFIIGGFLVGYGTSLGSGCTSGHGIAGLARMSPRSIAAVATFMAANVLVTTLLHTVGIGTGWKVALDAAGAAAGAA